MNGAVASLGSAWPDVIVAVVLLAAFVRSAGRVLGSACEALYRPAPQPGRSASN